MRWTDDVIQQSPDAVSTQLTADLAERKKQLKGGERVLLCVQSRCQFSQRGFCQVVGTPGDSVSLLIFFLK